MLPRGAFLRPVDASKPGGNGKGKGGKGDGKRSKVRGEKARRGGGMEFEGWGAVVRQHFIRYRERVRPYSRHTFDIRVALEVHSKYILGIPAAFCLNSWMLEPHSAAIP